LFYLDTADLLFYIHIWTIRCLSISKWKTQ